MLSIPDNDAAISIGVASSDVTGINVTLNGELPLDSKVSSDGSESVLVFSGTILYPWSLELDAFFA